MQHAQHDPLLVGLDAKSLRRLARYFRDQADHAARRAELLEHRARLERKLDRQFATAPYLFPHEKRAAARKARDIEIMRLARRGYSNKAIAEKTGLKSPQSVSRIIKKNLELNAARHLD